MRCIIHAQLSLNIELSAVKVLNAPADQGTALTIMYPIRAFVQR